MHTADTGSGRGSVTALAGKCPVCYYGNNRHNFDCLKIWDSVKHNAPPIGRADFVSALTEIDQLCMKNALHLDKLKTLLIRIAIQLGVD